MVGGLSKPRSSSSNLTLPDRSTPTRSRNVRTCRRSSWASALSSCLAGCSTRRDIPLIATIDQSPHDKLPAHSMGMVYVKYFTQLVAEWELKSKSSCQNGKQKEEPL